MRTKDDVKSDIVKTNLYLWGCSQGYHIKDQEFQQVCSLTREYASLCQNDSSIEKEMTSIFLSILQTFWANAVDVSTNYMDYENLSRGVDYMVILKNEVFVH